MDKDLKNDKSLKTAMVIGKIAIVLFVAVAIAAAIWAAVSLGQPKYHHNAELKLQTIDYRNKTYHYLSPSSICEFEIDKKIKNGVTSDISTVRNDPDCNFLLLSEFGNHAIFTSIEDFDEKYPSGEYQRDRVTSVKFCSESYDDWQTDDQSVIDLIMNIDKYSDGSTASYPLKGSAGFTCSVYLFEDNLAISRCNFGELAYYGGKWIFVPYGTDYEGEASVNVDTRTFTGIVINSEEAVEKLNSISRENFSYITEDN